MSIVKERNDMHDHEAAFESRLSERDPDDFEDDFDMEAWLKAEKAAQDRALILEAATPEPLRGKV